MSGPLPPTPLGTPLTSYMWAEFYEKVRRFINNAGNVLWSQITDFTGSTLTQIQTRDHKDLQNLQGGTTNEYYHMTSAQNTAFVAGVTVVITTAKLTGGGANGTMTFTNGILTAQTAAT